MSTKLASSRRNEHTRTPSSIGRFASSFFGVSSPPLRFVPFDGVDASALAVRPDLDDTDVISQREKSQPKLLSIERPTCLMMQHCSAEQLNEHINQDVKRGLN